MPQRPGSPPSSTPELTNAPSNYLLRIEWKGTNSPEGMIEVLTGEGQFQLSTFLPGKGESSEPALATPVTLNGTLKVLNSKQAQLQLFLGRSISYQISTPGQNMSSIQQRQEGLTVTFYVTFGKPVVARKDVTGEVTVLVKEQAP